MQRITLVMLCCALAVAAVAVSRLAHSLPNTSNLRLKRLP
jgi:hypothetical protein